MPDDDLINDGEDQIDNSETEEERLKRLQTEEEGKELLQNVISGNIKSLRDRVGYILNRFIDARNSDLELAWNYWSLFESDKFDGRAVTKAQLFSLTRINSLSRSRAKIQNEYKLFQADDSVKAYRGVLEKEKRNSEIQDKPSGLPIYAVYADETGKNQDYLCVGSLWLVEPGSYQDKLSLDKWKEENSISHEFHFSEVTRNKLNSYKEFFRRFISLNPTAGFKIIAVRNTGFRDLNQPLTDLTYHLLNRGIEHEDSTGRASLPRILQVWLDEEEAGSDSLKIENLKERIVSRNIEGLFLDNIQAVSSDSNYFIQAADLFTAAINRKINVSTLTTNHKDELADYILELTNFNIDSIDYSNSDIDNATVFNLTELRSEDS